MQLVTAWWTHVVSCETCMHGKSDKLESVMITDWVVDCQFQKACVYQTRLLWPPSVSTFVVKVYNRRHTGSEYFPLAHGSFPAHSSRVTCMCTVSCACSHHPLHSNTIYSNKLHIFSALVSWWNCLLFIVPNKECQLSYSHMQ